MLNKTPKADEEKIKSEPKLISWRIWVVLGLLLVLPSVVYGLYMMSRPSVDQPKKGYVYQTTCLSTENESECKVNLQIAADDATRIKGLSGRESMPEDMGMLFVSDDVEKQCFWMRDMNFSLDMVWLSEDKKVTKIQSDVAPDTYPEQFCSDIPDKYMVELNAGTAKRLGLKLGDQLNF